MNVRLSPTGRVGDTGRFADRAELCAAVWDAYAAGVPQTQIALACDVGYAVVSRIIKQGERKPVELA